MSTHYIEEAERLADEVAVMAHGKIISRGKPAELVAEHAGRETAEVYAPPERLAEVRAGAEAGPEGPPGRAGDRDRRRRARHRRRDPARGDPARGLARGRVRAADRGGGRVNEAAHAPRARHHEDSSWPPSAAS